MLGLLLLSALSTFMVVSAHYKSFIIIIIIIIKYGLNRLQASTIQILLKWEKKMKQ